MLYVTTFTTYFKIEYVIYCMKGKNSGFLGSIFKTSSNIFMVLVSKFSFIFSTIFPNILSLQNQIEHCTGIAFLIIFQYFQFYSSWSLKYCCRQKFRITWKQHDPSWFFLHFQGKCFWFTCEIKAKLIVISYHWGMH